MNIIYEITSDKVLPFIIFNKYEKIEEVLAIYNALIEDDPNKYLLNTDGRN